MAIDNTSLRSAIHDNYEMPTADSRLTSGKWTDLLVFMGPGMILTSVSIGNGEIFSASRGGAIFAYGLIWTFVFGAIMKAFIVYAGGRHIILTGEHPLTTYGRVIPGPRNWFAWFLGILCLMVFPAWTLSYCQVLAQWTNWVFGTEFNTLLLAVIWGFIGWVTVFLRSFRVVENFQTVIVLILVFFALVGLVVAQPNVLNVLAGLLPKLPDGYPDWVISKYPDIAARPIPLEIIAYLGALGGGTHDYVGYIGTFREKNWGMLGNPNLKALTQDLRKLNGSDDITFPLRTDEQTVKDSEAWLKAIRIDTGTSFALTVVFAVTFMVLGNAILGLNGLQVVPDNTNIMHHQAEFFTQIHAVLLYLYQLAIWAAFFGCLQALATTVYPSTFRECFAPSFAWLRKQENYYKLRIAICTYCVLGGFVLLFSGVEYTDTISFAGIMGGVFALGIWGIAQLYTDRATMPKQYQMRTWVFVCVLVSALVMFVMGVIGLLQFFGIV